MTTTTEHNWRERFLQNVFRSKTKSLACILVRKQVCLPDRRDAEAHLFKQVETSRKGKWQYCQVDPALRQWFSRCRRLLLVVAITIFKEMQQIKVIRYQGAVCRQFLQTDAYVCLSFHKWCRKMQNKHISLQIYIVFRVQQSTNMSWVSFHRFNGKSLIRRAAASRQVQEQRASSDSEIHGSNSGSQGRKGSLSLHLCNNSPSQFLCLDK